LLIYFSRKGAMAAPRTEGAEDRKKNILLTTN